MRPLTKLADFLLHAIFLLLMLMAIVLYKERLFADASYYFFHAVNGGWFHIEHGRTVLGISQILPILGYYLGMPLKILTLLSSLGHELFYYTIFLLLIYRIKDKAGAITVLMIHLIGQLWLYYSPMLEICYGAALVVLFYSILRTKKYEDDKWMIIMLISQWLAMTSHPENFLLIFFVMAYDFLERGWRQRVHLSSIVLFGIAILVEVLTFSSYELGKVGDVNRQASASNLLDVSYLKGLANLFVGYYPELIVFLIISATLMLFRKKFLKLTLLFGAVFFLLVIVNHSAMANEFTRYYESMYNPLVLLIVFVFMYEIYASSSKKVQLMLAFGLIGIASFRIVWIWDYGEPLRKRMNQMERIVDYAQGLDATKFIIDKQNFQKEYSHVAWSLPIETLIISAIDGKEASLSIATKKDYRYHGNNRKLSDSSYIFRRFELEDYSFLNDRFFELNQEAYQMLNTSVDSSNFNKKDLVMIKLNQVDELSFEKGDTVLQEVLINNRSEKLTLPSAKEAEFFIACHWYNADGSVYQWDGLRNTVELDIAADKSFIQDIKLAVPKEEGEYYIQPDLVIEGKMWLCESKKYKVVVTSP